MRILSVSAAMDTGGAERMAIDLARALTEAGHDVAIAAPAGDLDAEIGSAVRRVTFAGHGRSPARAVLSGVRLARFVRAFRPDVVHSHNVKATAIAGAATRLGRGLAAPPVVATFHGVVGADDRPAARVLRLAAVTACVSAELRDRLAGAGYPAERIRVIPNAVPIPPPLPAARRAELDRELDLGAGPVVAVVGRLAPVKAPHRFLEAAALVAAAEPAARFLVVGDGPLRAQLERTARDLRLDVTFTGAVPDARALIANADVMVVSSDSEGQSIATLEALAAGTPVVSTPVSGMPGLLGGGAGVIAADFSPETLAAAIRALVQDPARRTQMGAIGARLVREHFSADAMVDAYERRYRALTPTMIDS
jgi:glycosyltransferase involved in cell wall biosynthesis